MLKQGQFHSLLKKKKIVFFFKTKMSNILRKSYLFNFRSILREKIKKEIKNERRVTRQKAKRRGEWNEGESRWGKMPGEGTGLWASQVCYSPKTCSFHQDGKWEKIFIFFSDSWSINCCCNIRSYWSFRAFLLVRSQDVSQFKILAPRCPRYFVFQMREWQRLNKKWCILSSG